VARRASRPVTTCYLERALLLWPRLDRAKIRRFADDPARIAEIVEHRTSQPFDVILAMLTMQSPALNGAGDDTGGFDSGRADNTRMALHIVRSEEGNAIPVKELLPA
jgi:hypothetical protein